jgi:hypothetical protein
MFIPFIKSPITEYIFLQGTKDQLTIITETLTTTGNNNSIIHDLLTDWTVIFWRDWFLTFNHARLSSFLRRRLLVRIAIKIA